MSGDFCFPKSRKLFSRHSIMLLLLSGTNKSGSYQPPFIDKSTSDATSFDEPTSDETCSHLQEATAQVPRHSIRANWSQHCNPIGGDSIWQSFQKNPKIHFPLPGRGSNRAAARRSSHALEVGQVQILILSLTWGVTAFEWQVGSKAGRSFKFPAFPRRRGRSSQSWSLPRLCPGAFEQPQPLHLHLGELPGEGAPGGLLHRGQRPAEGEVQ